MGTDMLFYTQLFTSKRGPLANIWLAAHWARKLTKAHVFDCNLETSIRDIISLKMKMGLRTCSHLLLGVIRIYNRKAKYLISDCDDALLKMKMAFRPGETDLPVDALEATLNAITLIEDFTAFDTQLPPPSDIEGRDHFSLHQSRTEEITLREDFGRDILSLSSSRSEPNVHCGTLHATIFSSLNQQGDAFGDEGRFCDLRDFLSISNEWSDFMSEKPQNASPQNSTATEEQDADVRDSDRRETFAMDETTLHIDNAFALEPVIGTHHAEKKRLMRKRKLIVDVKTQLSNITIRNQLSDYSDLTSLLDIAPHTEKLMQCKERGGADVLFVQTCSAVISPPIKELFVQSIFKMKCFRFSEWVEEIHHDRSEVQQEISIVNLDNMTQVTASSTEGGDNTELTDGNTSEVLHPELLSEDSMFVHMFHSETPSNALHTQSVLDSQDIEERKITKRTHNLLDALKKSGHTTFTLATLCEGSFRSQAAATFASLLILTKERALNLHQDAPFQDIRATPGPTFYDE